MRRKQGIGLLATVVDDLRSLGEKFGIPLEPDL